MFYNIILAILFVLIIMSEITNDDVVEFKLSLVILTITIGLIAIVTHDEKQNTNHIDTQDSTTQSSNLENPKRS